LENQEEIFKVFNTKHVGLVRTNFI